MAMVDEMRAEAARRAWEVRILDGFARCAVDVLEVVVMLSAWGLMRLLPELLLGCYGIFILL